MSEHRYQFQGGVLAVASADPELADAVTYRFRDRRQATIPGEDVRVEFLVGEGSAQPRASTHDERRPVYDTPQGPIYYKPSEDALEAVLGGVRLKGQVRDGLATMWASRYEPEDRYLAAHPMTMIVLCEALKRRGRFSLHAGCIASGSRGVLIAGPSGSGKTTLVLALAARGLDFLSDDMVFLAPGDGAVEVHGFSDAIGVTCQTAARFGQLADLADVPPPRGFRKHLIRIEERFSVSTVEECEPACLIFPELAPGERSRLEPMERDEAWLRLVPDVLLTDPVATRAHLRAVAALTAQVACYRLRSGPDVAHSAELIERLIHDRPAV